MMKRFLIPLTVAFFSAFVILASQSSSATEQTDQVHPALLTVATRRCDTSTWYDERATFYRWLSDHDVMFVRHVWKFFRRDLRTGVERLMEGFTQTYYQHQSTIPDAVEYAGQPLGVDFLEVSPDGKSVLWCIDRTDLFTANLDGSGFKALKSSVHWPIYSLCWLEGGKEWAEVFVNRAVYISQVVVQDYNNPSSRKDFKIREGLVPNFYATYDFAASPVADGVRVYVGSWGTEKSFKVSEILLTSKQQEFKQEEISLPAGARLADNYSQMFSPHHDRIAWLFEFARDTEKPMIGLWVSQRDGSHMHEIGSVILESRLDEKWRPHDLRWLPDGRQLSFICNKALWTVPAD